MNYKKRSVCEFIITKIDHIVEHIIPFFDKHHILGSKHSNFLYFKRASYIIKNKEHLNNDGLGLKEILQLKGRITSLTQIRLWIITVLYYFFFIILSIVKKNKKKIRHREIRSKKVK